LNFHTVYLFQNADKLQELQEEAMHMQVTLESDHDN